MSIKNELLENNGPLNSQNVCRLPSAHGEQIDTPTPMYEITWRIFRIMSEFVEGFQFLSGTSREVSIFGSARFKAGNKWYKEARKLGRLLGKAGFTVTTGGGPGIMEAGNRGAIDVGAESIGLNIQLPAEQRANPYITKGRGFHYFFTRKVMLAASAQAYVYFPGGFGTMDEFFEILTLIQTKKMRPTPIVCVGSSYWKGLIKWIEKTMMEEEKTINPKDRKLFHIVDTAEEAFEIVCKSEERSIF